jgi:hypothetical protein
MEVSRWSWARRSSYRLAAVKWQDGREPQGHELGTLEQQDLVGERVEVPDLPHG